MKFYRSLLFWRLIAAFALCESVVLIVALRLEARNAGPVTTGVLAGFVGVLLFAPAAARATSSCRKLLQTVIDSRDQDVSADAQGLAAGNDEVGSAAEALVSLLQQSTERSQQAGQTADQYRSAADQFAAMVQAMAEGVVAVDANERILFANNVFCRMFELTAAAITGRPIFEVVRNAPFLDVLRECLQQRRQATSELRLLHRNVQVAVSASPMSDSGAVIVLNDVSELRRLESVRRDFISGVSHELKTPLTVIQACTDTLLDGAADDPEMSRRFLTQINEQAERLLELILKMLQLARVESGDQLVTREPVDLRAAAEGVCRSLATVAESRGVTLELQGDTECTVAADHEAVSTMISNLVDNAIKYTPDGGRVTVSVRTDEAGSRIDVTDTGSGISRNDIDRVFERFYRVDRDRNRESGGGTGLGLAIVKHLCQALGAEISVQSTPGRGSTFSVVFPEVRSDA